MSDYQILHGDCIEVMRGMAENSVDAIVTDPPYALTSGKKGGTGVASINLDSPYGRSRISTGNGSGGFMGKQWDAPGDGTPLGFQVWCQEWATEALRTLRPGGHLLAFGSSRTFHRLTCGIEDAGFECRDTLTWHFGSGFPKSLDVAKSIEASLTKGTAAKNAFGGLNGERTSTAKHGQQKWAEKHGFRDADYCEQTGSLDLDPTTDEAKKWQGFGTALKPATEFIVLARKPLIGTVAANVLQYGAGALNIDGCRVESGVSPSVAMRDRSRATGKTPGRPGEYRDTLEDRTTPERYMQERPGEQLGRWPANVLLDESAAELLDAQSGTLTSGIYTGKRNFPKTKNAYGTFELQDETPATYGDSGGASRFFYTAKASRAERGKDNTHPTVKPVDLMRWLVRLVTPPGGVCLDPFAGSGTTLVAALNEGFDAIGIEREDEYVEIIRRRLAGQQMGFALSLDEPA